jgi:hypothetical protein
VDTFWGHLQLATLGDLDGLDRLVARGGLHLLDLLDDIIALEDLAEDDVAAIQPAVGNGISDRTRYGWDIQRALTR